MEKLAIDGGIPVRSEKLYYGRQWVDEDDVKAVADTLQSDFITCGPKVEELEMALSLFTTAKYAVAVSNGTAALHCACIAADIDMKTYNIDPVSCEEKITEKTKAIVAVDFTGQAVKLKELRKICDKHGLILIEDAAHAIGTKYNKTPIGSIADMTCFSFHPVKTITSGEGGAITTNKKEFYGKLVLAHSHGITHDEEMMEGAPHEGIWYYEQISLGYNYRMTDFQAALLLSQLKKLEKFKARRQKIVKRYDEVFGNFPEIIIQQEIKESDTCRHLYIIRLNFNKLRCSRQQFFEAMAAENIQCQIHYIPVYWFPFYKRLGYKIGLCPNAEEVYNGILSIPLYPKMTNEDVEDVIHAVIKIMENFRI